MVRVRRSVAERVALIDQWRASGLSLPAFCARRGLNAKTMSGWVYKPAHQSAIEKARREALTVGVPPEPMAPSVRPQAAFLPIQVADVPSRASASLRCDLEIVLASGPRIVVRPGFDRETLRRVVAALEGRPC
jgi:hypothetical protein